MEKLKEAITDVSTTGKSREVSLVFTEAVVNEKAAQILVGTEISAGGLTSEVSGVNLDLQAGNLIAVEIRGTAYGLGIIIRVTARLSIQEGKPVVEVIEAIGFDEDLIADAITQAVDSLLIQLIQTEAGDNENVDIEFTDVSVGQDEMTLTVMVKPGA